jgi:hypothetical protein
VFWRFALGFVVSSFLLILVISDRFVDSAVSLPGSVTACLRDCATGGSGRCPCGGLLRAARGREGLSR